jgi:hypothetical protein
MTIAYHTSILSSCSSVVVSYLERLTRNSRSIVSSISNIVCPAKTTHMQMLKCTFTAKIFSWDCSQQEIMETSTWATCVYATSNTLATVIHVCNLSPVQEELSYEVDFDGLIKVLFCLYSTFIKNDVDNTIHFSSHLSIWNTISVGSTLHAMSADLTWNVCQNSSI